MSAAPAQGNQPQSAQTGLGPSIEEIHAIQRAQAAHARTQQVERLCRQFQVVSEIIEELAASKARVIELENQISGTQLPDETTMVTDGADVPKIARRGRKPKLDNSEASSEGT